MSTSGRPGLRHPACHDGPVQGKRIAACIAVVCAVGPPAGSTATAADPTALAVLARVPDGWHVLGAQAPQAVDEQASAPFYARSAGDGPALTVGSVSCED